MDIVIVDYARFSFNRLNILFASYFVHVYLMQYAI